MSSLTIALAFAVAAQTAPAAPAPAPAAASPPAEAGKRGKALRIALTQLDVSDVDPKVARVVEDSLLVELRKLSRVSVIGMNEIRQMIDYEAGKQALGCGVDGACLAEIADAVGVDVVVAASLANVGSENVIAMRRIDQRNAAVAGTFTKRLAPAGGEEFLAAVGPGVAVLFPDVPLRPGAARGVDAQVALRLNPPPLPVWSTLVTGVAALSLAGAGAAVGVAMLGLQSEYDAFAETGRPSAPGGGVAIDGARLVEKGAAVENAALAANVLLASAVVAGAAAGVMVPFTDWSGE